MSGHSKFANIKHKKEKNDAAKGKIFTIIGREIAIAVKELSQFFMEHLTVARLQKLTAIISQMMNPAGFISSIRLIREVGTTKPNPEAERIE